MKKALIEAVAAGILITGISGTALAGNLINDDSKKYDVTVQCGGATTRGSINSKTQQNQAFSPGCTVSVGGVGSIKAGKKNLLIKGGRLGES